MHATPQPMQPAPFATWNPTRGIWETGQLDLFAQPEPYSAIFPTCGMTRNGSAYRLPEQVPLTTDSASSSSPPAAILFRTPLASDSSRGGETLEQVRARRGTIALSDQIIDLALHGPNGSPSRPDESETLFILIETIFTAGDATPMPSPVGNTSPDDRHPRQLS